MAEGREDSVASPSDSLAPRTKSYSQVQPFIEYTSDQVESFRQIVQEMADSSVVSIRSRLLKLHSVSSDIFHRSSETFAFLKTELTAYEVSAIGKLKDGLLIAAHHPSITLSITAGSAVLLLKRPRRFLFHRAMRLFVSEESMIASAEEKVKQLRQSVELVKNESRKLEERARFAEEEMKRGQMKLKQAGNQIQGVIRSVDKIERQVRGLKDVLGELPRVEASRFRSQISSIASEARHARSALGKAVAKISNYGISV